jgi:glycine/D-amino acid oxidase-like deaminating enzyme
VVVGGGLLGSALTYYLASEGIDTLLLERGELNREASGANAGSLHIQVMRQPDWSPEWLARIAPSFPLHLEAARHWRTLEKELDADLGVRFGGGLMVAETEAQLERLQQKARLERSIGLDTEVLSRAELCALSPSLSEALVGADYCPDEGFANPLRVAPAFRRAALRAGARVRTRCEVESIEPSGPGRYQLATTSGAVRAGRVVNAAGAWAAPVARMLGVRLPVAGGVLQVMVTEPSPPTLSQLVQHIERRLTLKQTPAGTFLIGGGWAGGFDADSRRATTEWDSIAGNAWVAARTVPALADLSLVRTWAGVGANTPDWLPILGEVPGAPGFFMLFVGLGFTLGPVCARLVAEAIRGATTTLSITPFSPGRFRS